MSLSKYDDFFAPEPEPDSSKAKPKRAPKPSPKPPVADESSSDIPVDPSSAESTNTALTEELAFESEDVIDPPRSDSALSGALADESPPSPVAVTGGEPENSTTSPYPASSPVASPDTSPFKPISPEQPGSNPESRGSPPPRPQTLPPGSAAGLKTPNAHTDKRASMPPSNPNTNRASSPALAPEEEVNNELALLVSVRLRGMKGASVKKHIEWEVCSEKAKAGVTRRFREFLWLHEELEKSHPYRIVCPLPKKQFKVTHLGRFSSEFLEARRVGLQHFVNYAASHSTLGQHPALHVFLSHDGELNKKTRNSLHNVDESTGKMPSGKMLPVNAEVLLRTIRKHVEKTCDTLEQLIERATKMESLQLVRRDGERIGSTCGNFEESRWWTQRSRTKCASCAVYSSAIDRCVSANEQVSVWTTEAADDERTSFTDTIRGLHGLNTALVNAFVRSEVPQKALLKAQNNLRSANDSFTDARTKGKDSSKAQAAVAAAEKQVSVCSKTMEYISELDMFHTERLRHVRRALSNRCHVSVQIATQLHQLWAGVRPALDDIPVEVAEDGEGEKSS